MVRWSWIEWLIAGAAALHFDARAREAALVHRAVDQGIAERHELFGDCAEQRGTLRRWIRAQRRKCLRRRFASGVHFDHGRFIKRWRHLLPGRGIGRLEGRRGRLNRIAADDLLAVELHRDTVASRWTSGNSRWR